MATMKKAKAGKNISAGVNYKKTKAPMVDKPGKLGKGAFSEVQIRTLGKMKSGGTIKKAEDGVTTGKQNRLARQEKRVYNRYTDAKASGNTKRAGRLYDKLIDKQTKSINAGVNVQYKSGGKMTKGKKC